MTPPNTEPSDAVAAATHTDPYPYYERLRREAPLQFDEALGLWVASTTAVVREALGHPDLRVRPPAEPLPKSIAGTAAGELFSLLVRMNDGEFHRLHRPGVDEAVGRISLEHVASAARDAARDLAPRVGPNELLSCIPVQAMARVIGIAPDLLNATTQQVVDFVAAITPGATAEAVESGARAAAALMAPADAQGWSRAAVANRVALMQQSLDATAGLIGNAIVHLPPDGELPSAAGLREHVAAVSQRDPSVHSTRRFAAKDLELAGRHIREGQGLLLLLASAGLGFGDARHACPGERIAIEVAASAIGALHALGDIRSRFGKPRGFRPLANARVPVFSG